MSKLKELIDRLCPNGVEYRPLGNVVELLDSQRKPVSKVKRKEGIYPYYGANGIQDYVDDFIFDGTFLLVGEDGSVINPDKSPILNWVEGKIWVNNHAHILKETQVANLRFIFYALQVADVSDIVRGTPPKLNQTNLKGIMIPVPPIEVQEEIVRILDRFADYTAELQAELQARKEQYEYYRNLLLTFNSSACETDGEQAKKLTTWGMCNYEVAWRTMGEIGKVKMCKRIMKHQTSNNGDIPFFKIGTFGKEADAFISRELFEEYRAKYPYPTKGAILISAAGTIGRCVVYKGDESYYQDSNIIWLENDETQVINSYLFHYYKITEWKTDGGTIKRLYNDRLLSTPIAVPPIELQKKIVAILDRFETLVNDLTKGLPAEIAAVKEQYEYYRNKLLSFPRKKISA